MSGLQLNHVSKRGPSLITNTKRFSPRWIKPHQVIELWTWQGGQYDNLYTPGPLPYKPIHRPFSSDHPWLHSKQPPESQVKQPSSQVCMSENIQTCSRGYHTQKWKGHLNEIFVTHCIIVRGNDLHSSLTLTVYSKSFHCGSVIYYFR